jgi:hypothetical protein
METEQQTVANYIRLLKGEGIRYIDSNLYILPNSRQSIEERAANKVCPPTNLNPNYNADPKVRRTGKFPQRQQTTSTNNKPPLVDPTVLRHIFK